MNAAKQLIKSLEHEGITHIFGVAGEENLHLLEAIRESKIIYVPCRHEQAAGFMAAAYGRLTGKIGVALSTLGPGATNFVTSVAYAKLGAMPCLFITGQKPIRDNKQGNFQIVDIVDIMTPISKKSTSISIPRKVASIVRESIRVAEEERPGPTHIEIPKDICLEEIEESTFPFDPKVRRPIAEYKAIVKAVELIESARSPILLIGASANRKLTRKMLTEFVDETGIPFIDTQMGKGVIDEDNPNFIGTAALTSGDFVHKVFDNADLIINVGHDIIEKSPFLMQRNSNQKVIHINYFSAEVHEYYFPQLEVMGDIANTIWQIKEKISKQDSWDFSKAKEIQKVIQTEIYNQTEPGYFEENNNILKPQQIVGAVRTTVGKEDILCLDNGMYKLWFARYYKANFQNTILLDNALATMGAGLPSAIAAKLVKPDKNVIAVVGDGGFMMNSQEIETAIRLNLDLIILLINDNGLGMIKWEQDEKEYPSFGLDHKNPDFVKYAESYGAHGHKVSNRKELEKKLTESIDKGGIHLIEVPVDYSENLKVFSR